MTQAMETMLNAWIKQKNPGKSDVGQVVGFLREFGKKRPGDVDPADYLAWLLRPDAKGWVKGRDVRPSTSARRRDAVNSLLNFFEWTHPGSVPKFFAKPPLAAADNRRTYFLETDVRDAFIAAFPEGYRPLIAFLFHTGCRWSEMANLRWDDVEDKDATLCVTFRNRKNKSRTWCYRTIPLSTDAAATLSARGHPNEYVFTDPKHGGKVRYDATYRLHRKVCKATGADPVGGTFRIHDYRHTWATLAHHQGMEIGNVAAMLGDTVQTTSRRYVHQTPRSLMNALDKIAAKPRPTPPLRRLEGGEGGFDLSYLVDRPEG